MSARLQFWVCALAIVGAAATTATACRPGITQTRRTLLQRGLGSGVALQAGNTYCGEMAPQGACGLVNTTSKPLKCTVGGKGTTMVYQPTSGDSARFDPENFDKTCLVNAGVACDHPANGDATAKGKTDPDMACCSCYLFKKHCAGASGQYVYNNDLLRTTTVHSLLMPTSGCTGVENALTPACPLGESIWNQGQSDLDSSGKDKLNWGMAINPIFRRGQHQMHIHLAEVQPTLIDNIKYGFGKENRTSFYLNCGLSDTKRTMEGCKVLPVGSKPDRHTPHVVISRKIKQPSEATPFANVYKVKPDKSVDSVLYTSTLVIRVPGSSEGTLARWATVTNAGGPAECFFKLNGEGACSNST